MTASLEKLYKEIGDFLLPKILIIGKKTIS